MTTDRSKEEVTPIEKVTRPWLCKKGDESCSRKAPCRSCLGRRNRRGGLTKQRAARKALGIPSAQFAGLNGNEENWRGPVRVEVKSGAIAGPVWTKYALSEKQAEQNKATGDPRPFLAVFMPAGMTDGLFVGRISQLAAIVEAFANWGPEEVA